MSESELLASTPTVYFVPCATKKQFDEIVNGNHVMMKRVLIISLGDEDLRFKYAGSGISMSITNQNGHLDKNRDVEILDSVGEVLNMVMYTFRSEER
jgi:hypothetical protein